MDVAMERIKQKIYELSKRANAIKTDPGLRHAPNKHDLQVASGNAHFMQPFQHESIASEGK